MCFIYIYITHTHIHASPLKIVSGQWGNKGTGWAPFRKFLKQSLKQCGRQQVPVFTQLAVLKRTTGNEPASNLLATSKGQMAVRPWRPRDPIWIAHREFQLWESVVCVYKTIHIQPINVIWTPCTLWSKLKQEIKLAHCSLQIRAEMTITIILQNIPTRKQRLWQGLTVYQNIPSEMVYNKLPTESLCVPEWIFPSSHSACAGQVWSVIRLLEWVVERQWAGPRVSTGFCVESKWPSRSLRVWLLKELCHSVTAVCSENTDRARKIWREQKPLSQWATTLKHIIFDSLLWVAGSMDWFSLQHWFFHLIIKYNLSEPNWGAFSTGLENSSLITV
jgi:hypothetical protein